jgi:hypothetical protein
VKTAKARTAAIIRDNLKIYTAYSAIVVEVVISFPPTIGYLTSSPLSTARYSVALAKDTKIKELKKEKRKKITTKRKRNLLNSI